MKQVSKHIIRTFFCALLLSCSVAFGQTPVEILSRTKDVINARLTLAVLNNDSVRYKANPHYRQVTAQLQKSSYDSVVPYPALKNLLSNKYDSLHKRVTAKIAQLDAARYAGLPLLKAVELLTDEAYLIVRQSYGSEVSISEKDNIYNDIISQLPATRRATNRRPQSTELIHQSSSAAHEGALDTPAFFGIQNYTLGLLLYLLIAGALFLFCLRQLMLMVQKKPEQAIMAEERETKEGEATEQLPQQNPLVPVYNEYRESVTTKMQDLFETISSLKQRMAQLEAQQTITTAATHPKATNENEDILYMAAPVENYFHINATTTPQQAIFRLRIGKNKQEAKFDVLDTPAAIQTAMESPLAFEAACIATSAHEGPVTKIKTTFSGIAALKDDKWIIRRKAIVVFT